MKVPIRLIVVEDSPSDAALVARSLERAGHALDWRRVETLPQLEAALREQAWDAVLSDNSLPGFDARGALAMVRAAAGDLPFIVVSGEIGEKTAVELMRAGAHDYVNKSELARLAPALERELTEADARRARRETERALHESEEHLRIALQGSATVVFNQDRDLRYRWVYNAHPAFAMHDLVGMRDEELFPADVAAKLTAIKTRVLDSGEPAREEVAIPIDGGVIHYLLSVEPWRDESGAIVGVVCTSTDITDLKRSELRIREQLEELRRWQELTIGRESRILELKREVNELLRESGRAPRYASVDATGELNR